MERFLIWFMHPEKNSFNGAVQDVFQKELQKLGKETEARFISELDMSLTLTRGEYTDSLHGEYPAEIEREHRYIEWADGIILMFPLWWGSFPAVGKGFLDRVLSYGFAYELEGETPVPRMSGKKVGAVYTTGTPDEVFAGTRTVLEQLWEEQIFSFCGFDCMRFVHLGNVVQTGDQHRKQMLEEVKAYARELAALSTS
ncbi:NAD(P)H-dependent oxidoreductase [Salibacterium aidingense]|uniref:NAD(P)H-dependent oxidoreductase n=1 Tax=Salibacterium aidingense TaxID=384933 RepID=UPI003BC53A8E